jgi:hypothetical protein
VAGKRGHLSNVMAGEVIFRHAAPELEYVFLSHISENNNTSALALDTIHAAVKERDDLHHLQILLTSRHGVSPVVKLDSQISRLFKHGQVREIPG